MKRRVAFDTLDRWGYAVRHPVAFVHDVLRELRWLIRRGVYGYSGRDLWSLDSYISAWLPSALRGLKDCGYPGDTTADSWNNMLESMASDFDIVHVDMFNPSRNDDDYYAAYERAMDAFKEHFFDLWC